MNKEENNNSGELARVTNLVSTLTEQLEHKNLVIQNLNNKIKFMTEDFKLTETTLQTSLTEKQAKITSLHNNFEAIRKDRSLIVEQQRKQIEQLEEKCKKMSETLSTLKSKHSEKTKLYDKLYSQYLESQKDYTIHKTNWAKEKTEYDRKWKETSDIVQNLKTENKTLSEEITKYERSMSKLKIDHDEIKTQLVNEHNSHLIMKQERDELRHKYDNKCYEENLHDKTIENIQRKHNMELTSVKDTCQFEITKYMQKVELSDRTIQELKDHNYTIHKDFEGKIKLLQTSCEKKLSEYNAHVNLLQEKINTQERELLKYKEELININNRTGIVIEQYKSKIQKIMKEKTDVESKLDHEIKKYQKMEQDASTTIHQLRERIESVRKDIEKGKIDIEISKQRIIHDYESKIKNMNDSFSEMMSKIEVENKQKLVFFENARRQNMDKIREKDKTITSLKNTISLLEVDVTKYKTFLNRQEKNFADKVAEMKKSLMKSTVPIQSTNDGLRKSRDQAMVTIREQKEEIDNLKARLDDIMIKMQDMTKLLEAKEEELKNFSTSFREMKDSYLTNLNNQNATHLQEMIKKTERIDQLEKLMMQTIEKNITKTTDV